ncbi:MAG: MerR family DNA-binding transcriptional regulator, partial [Elusimicrobiota bacterium]|nr:MerR family DNA-binding transcriptional regulator [Elusimicrobiota bacterium]
MICQGKEFVKIGEIASASGLPVSTVRYYTELGLLSEAYRTPGDVRVYKKGETLRKIKEITAAA